jgi:integration host factor subunit beta
MKKSDLIQRLAADTGLPVTKTEDVVNRVFQGMTDSLANGERVEIRGFGSFKIKHYDGYQGLNPTTREIVDVKPKKMPYFKCGKELKERVDL